MAGKSAAVLLVCYFLSSLKNDGVSVEWAASLLKFFRELERDRSIEFACSFFMFLAHVWPNIQKLAGHLKLNPA